ncbi:GerAB/ArcD/ProY family transporter [Cohnella mopanensis]|uniref:GerAB/ArcD/ProY family transporter n=1 Tax=Cohnella mopanensis TaxID=2911966 RepID=UPI001EF9A00D|nr:GerAB/ArcD/ProY family transporter [Cohnella mopanensis]
MIAAKEKITAGQFMIVVIQAQIGVGILFLPSSVESVARNDAWISILLAGMAALLLSVVMWGLNRRFPTMTLFEFLPKLLGKFAGKIVQIFYGLAFILECSMVLVLFTDVVRDWIFPITPRWVILGLMLATALYMARENIRLIARFFVLTFGLIFVLILIAAYAYKDANILYILPINESGISNVLKGMLRSMNSLYGFEMILLCYPYVKGGSKGILKATLFACVFSTLVYSFMVFMCLIVFSPEELKIIPQPVLYMVKALSFTVIERADLYFLTIWTVVVITTVMAYLYMGAKAVASIFGKKKHAGAVPYVALLILCISLYPHDQELINKMQIIVGIIAAIALVVLPFLLLCISYLFRIKGKEGAEG